MCALYLLQQQHHKHMDKKKKTDRKIHTKEDKETNQQTDTRKNSKNNYLLWMCYLYPNVYSVVTTTFWVAPQCTCCVFGTSRYQYCRRLVKWVFKLKILIQSTKKIDLKLSTMDRPVHENNYVKSSLDLSVFEMLKLNSSYHLGYDQKQQKRKEQQKQQQNIEKIK